MVLCVLEHLVKYTVTDGTLPLPTIMVYTLHKSAQKILCITHPKYVLANTRYLQDSLAQKAAYPKCTVFCCTDCIKTKNICVYLENDRLWLLLQHRQVPETTSGIVRNTVLLRRIQTSN